MKLLLLHGSAIKTSRLHLATIKQKFNSNDVMVYESGTEISEILGGLMTQSLLNEERLIILENPPEDFSFDLSLVTSHLSLVIWFDHEVLERKPVMEWVKKSGQILFFPEGKEVSIFPFLDYLTSGNKKAFLELKKLKDAGFDTQYFITMVFYLLRNLIATPKKAPQFVQDKLQRQRRSFNLERIMKLYYSLLEIDFKIKSGLLETPQAEFSLINLFCH